jgi:predicted amidophosphoribosyltransferase
MADVKICDRCGKTISKSNNILRNAFKAHYYSLFNPDLSRDLISNWDLCDDCGKKLERFLKGEELVKDAQSSSEDSTE